MSNNLLDFVMALVRDPDMAAQYAANPVQAIADANLVGVQPADVSSLIPVVAESAGSAGGSVGAGAGGFNDFGHSLATQGLPSDTVSNGWAHAASAFDAPTHDPSLDGGLGAGLDHAASAAQAINVDAITVPDPAQIGVGAAGAVSAIDQFHAPLHPPMDFDLDPLQTGSDLGAAASPVLHDPFLDPTINAEQHHVIDLGIDHQI